MNREDMRQRCQALYEEQRTDVAEIRAERFKACDQAELALRLALVTEPPEELSGGVMVDDALHEICGELALLRDAFTSEDVAHALCDDDSRGGVYSVLARAIERLELLRAWESVAREKVRELTDPEMWARLASITNEPTPRRRRARATADVA